MKQLVLPFIFLGMAAGEAVAQQVIPPLKKEFLDSTWHVLPSAAGARYRRETEYRDSTAGTIRDYYLSGQLQSREEFEHIRKRSYDGLSEYFYESGQLKGHAEYAHGKRNGEFKFYFPDGRLREREVYVQDQPSGELVLYYPTGQLKRREHYAAGKRTAGECFAPDGKQVPFFEYEVMPRYSEGDGGFAAIIQAIGRNFHYPKDARRAGVEGRVLVSFSVTALGQVADVQIKESLFPSVDAEAIQAVYRLKRFTPGQQDGQPVKVAFTAPITLRLQ
jgi:protein TonB